MPSSKARSMWLDPRSAEIIITGMSSIQRYLFICVSTPKPSITGITMSSSTREISGPCFCSMATPSSPFSASMISNSPSSISARIARFISESSTINIFCLSVIFSKVCVLLLPCTFTHGRYPAVGADPRRAQSPYDAIVYHNPLGKDKRISQIQSAPPAEKSRGCALHFPSYGIQWHWGNYTYHP